MENVVTSKKLHLSSLKKIMFRTIILIITLNGLLTLATGINIIEIGIKKVLNSIGIYTEEVSSIEITSDGYKNEEEGTWNVTKSAKWTGTSTADVTFEIDTIIDNGSNYKDVIFVIDISGSMAGDKIEKVKSDTEELTKYILSDSQNKVALITFDGGSNLLTPFTNNQDTIIEQIKSLKEAGNTNYNAALAHVDAIMDDYIKEDNRDLVVLFLTDGYPNIDSPNQKAMYQILKEKYPYMQINGVQYEMGQNIVKDVQEVTDKQYFADINTLNNTLFEAAIDPKTYDSFEVVDYIHDDYFYINSEEDIKVSIGTVTLSEENGVQKIVWDLGKSFKTDGKATMNINLTLKEQYVGKEGYYPTNKSEEIRSKMPDAEQIEKTSNDTPVLKSDYKVIYEPNPPTGCDISDIVEETHFVYESVSKRENDLTCSGYIFKGWEIIDNDVTSINNDTFIMPSHDVTLRATWTKQTISKSMDGTVHEKTTLYKVIKNEAENGTYASEYTGEGSEDYSKNVYYYQGPVTDNNVLFANFCWKMIRTTETGGVKLIYNGIPTDGSCDNTGTNSQIATLSQFNGNSNSLAYIGYMYNTLYTSTAKTMLTTTTNDTNLETQPIYRVGMTNSYNYYFSKSFTYDETTGKYQLEDATQLGTWTDIYSTMTPENYGEGYYTCKNTSSATGTCTTLYYILGGVKLYAYTIPLKGVESLSDADTTIYLATEVTDSDNDGVYELAGDITQIKRSEWYDNYASYTDQYVCSDLVSTTCSEYRLISTTTIYNFKYFTSAKNYKYGNDVYYNETDGVYELIDTENSEIKEVWNYGKDYTTLGKNHYTCFNETGKCENVYYVYYLSSTTAYHITLSESKKVEDALNEMLWADDVNTNDSILKDSLDTWYESNMTDFTQYLEDTVFCNDRTIFEKNGWDPNSGSTVDYLYFYEKGNTSLVCKNKNDQFTMSSDIGNGKLSNPVGLLTINEYNLAVSNTSFTTNYLTTGENYWMMSPGIVRNGDVYGILLYDNGALYNAKTSEELALRPVVSLVPGTEYSSGDGSASKPYVVSLDT